MIYAVWNFDLLIQLICFRERLDPKNFRSKSRQFAMNGSLVYFDKPNVTSADNFQFLYLCQMI